MKKTKIIFLLEKGDQSSLELTNIYPLTNIKYHLC